MQGPDSPEGWGPDTWAPCIEDSLHPPHPPKLDLPSSSAYMCRTWEHDCDAS